MRECSKYSIQINIYIQSMHCDDLVDQWENRDSERSWNESTALVSGRSQKSDPSLPRVTSRALSTTLPAFYSHWGSLWWRSVLSCFLAFFLPQPCLLSPSEDLPALLLAHPVPLCSLSVGHCRAPSLVNNTVALLAAKARCPHARQWLQNYSRLCQSAKKEHAHVPAPRNASVRKSHRGQHLCLLLRCSWGVRKALPCSQGNGYLHCRMSLKEGAQGLENNRNHDLCTEQAAFPNPALWVIKLIFCSLYVWLYCWLLHVFRTWKGGESLWYR